MRKVLTLSFLALLLSSCVIGVRPGDVTVGLRFGFELTPTIVRLSPNRGEGSTYLVGETINFVISTNRPGYITLVSIDPDGSSNVLDRSFYQAGTYTIPGPGSRVEYTIAPPRGLQRVRAIFTDSPAPATVTLEGRYSSDGWDRQTSVYIRGSNAQVRDVAETFFYIR